MVWFGLKLVHFKGGEEAKCYTMHVINVVTISMMRSIGSPEFCVGVASHNHLNTISNFQTNRNVWTWDEFVTRYLLPLIREFIHAYDQNTTLGVRPQVVIRYCVLINSRIPISKHRVTNSITWEWLCVFKIVYIHVVEFLQCGGNRPGYKK